MSKEYESRERGENKLPQYGKKGHKPRKPYTRKEASLDEIRTNDISYWNKTSGYSDVTKFNWDLIVGRGRDARQIYDSSILQDNINPSIIMAVDFIMGPGWASDVNSATNRSLAILMGKIRSALSTSNIGFETADLGIFFASTSSIAALIGYAKRVLESYQVWKDRNYAYPRALLKTFGVSYGDISSNINTYSAQLNSAIDRYNNMSILDCFDIYDRQYSMCHNIFADEDSEFGQLYVFRPVNYYVYDDTTTPNQATSTAFSPNGFDSIMYAINGALDAWYNSSDLYQINGTLLRAFKDAPRQSIPHYVQSDLITPVVDRAFLMQIMNCTIHGDLVSGPDITQDPITQNYVIWKPKSTNSVSSLGRGPSTMLRLFENDVNAEDCMELTRLINFKGLTTESDYYIDCGSEIVVGIRCISYDTARDADNITSITSNVLIGSLNTTDPTSTKMGNVLHSVGAISPFRYLPALHLILRNASGTSEEYCGIVGDVYNWMIYSKEDWKMLQFVAFQSLWTPKNI